MKISDDMLYKYAAEARDAWLDTLPHKNEVPMHKFSRHFEKKMHKLIIEQRRSPSFNRFMRSTKRAAAVAIVILGITFSGFMTVEAYREKFIEMVTQVFQELTSFHFSSATETGEVFIPATFSYLPEGMKEITQEQNNLELYTRFETADGQILKITQTYIDENMQASTIIDTEDADVTHFTVQGEDAISTTKKGNTTIVFTKGQYIFNLNSNLPIEQIKQVAEEIKIN